MKVNTINYYVIGGQYRGYNYGGTETLNAAKRLATKEMEYWDNWKGWHYPKIYMSSDCEWVNDSWFGRQMLPKEYKEPIAIKNYGDKKWTIINREDDAE